ncbi:MAG: DUF58 domain-containing protein [Bryobacteraceae bacterium]
MASKSIARRQFAQLEELLSRLKAAFEGSVRQQVTRAGLIFTMIILMVGMAAFVSANNLLFLLFAALLSTFLISNLISRLGLAGLELNLLLPEHIAAKREVAGRIVVRNSKRLIPSFSIHLTGAPNSGLATELYFPVVPGAVNVDEPVQLLFAKRGLYRENIFWFSSSFPFGFTSRRAQVRVKREQLVYPSIDAQDGFEAMLSDLNGEISAIQRGRGHDFYRLRPYEHLESARHVDWKATAHTGSLQVREFSREQDQAVTLFLDLEVPLDAQEWFEKAVECCAFLCWRLSVQGTRFRFATQQFDRQVPDESNVYSILKYLATVAPAGGLKTPSPDADRNIRIAISANPSRLVDAGWTSARLYGIDDLSGTGAGSAEDR